MKTFFFNCRDDMSQLMLDMHRDGLRVIVCRGAFDDEGNQGWNISYI